MIKVVLKRLIAATIFDIFQNEILLFAQKCFLITHFGFSCLPVHRKVHSFEVKKTGKKRYMRFARFSFKAFNE